MTEAEWLTAVHPTPLLRWVRDRTSDRKLRLFACGCCRRVLHLMPDQRSRTALEVAERFADGLASEPAERAAAWQALLGVPHVHAGWALHPDPLTAAASGADGIARAVRMQQRPFRRYEAWRGEQAWQAALARNVFGNPFRFALLDPSWLTSDVLALALGIYDERAFDRMPILADALQDAGCEDEDVLGHCRGPGPHVRGCWVVDLLLGKS